MLHRIYVRKYLVANGANRNGPVRAFNGGKTEQAVVSLIDDMVDLV